MKKALIYGLGYNFRVMMEYADLDGIEIVGYVDRAKNGAEMYGKRILAPEEICDTRYDLIFITPKEYEEIVETLSVCYAVEKEKMILPVQINCEYIFPRVKNAKNIFFAATDMDFFAFLFRPLERSGQFLIIDILNDSAQYVPGEVSDEEKCFVFGGYDIKRHQDNRLFASLKATYPNADMVMLMCDKCEGKCGRRERLGTAFSQQFLSSTFDFCVTYHMADAKKYGFYYYPQIYPANALELKKSDEETEVFFVGNAKNRLKLLYSVFLKLTNAGVRCKFWICGVDIKDQLEIEGLYYLNQIMPYEDYLKEMNKCRCILEVCEEGDETSYRYAEAVVYGKKLLVNDSDARKLKYYSPENMQIFSSADDIDLNWFEQMGKDYQYEGDLEPEYFLRQVLSVL